MSENHSRARQILAENPERLLQLVLDAIPVRVFFKDRDSVYLGANQRFAQDAGLGQGTDLVGRADHELVWADQADLYGADDAEVMRRGVPKVGFEEPQTTPEGGELWLRTSKVPLVDDNGEVIGLLGTYEDITEYKQLQSQMARDQKRLEGC